MKTKLEELKQELADAQARLAANPTSATLQRIVKNREHDVAKAQREAAQQRYENYVVNRVVDAAVPAFIRYLEKAHPAQPGQPSADEIIHKILKR